MEKLYFDVESSPAIENLSDSNISPTKKAGKLFEASDLPNKIIRIENAKDLLSRHDDAFELPELVREAQIIQEELRVKYGICAPFDNYKMGEDENGNKVVYCIVDKIEGKSLANVNPSGEFVEQVENLYTSVAKYFLDKKENGELYLWDICGQSQYIYGKKLNDHEDKIYLVDADIWMSRSGTGMYLTLEWLARHMSAMETRVNKQFEKAREYIKQAISKTKTDEIDQVDTQAITQNIDRINRILNGEKIDDGPDSAIPPFE